MSGLQVAWGPGALSPGKTVVTRGALQLHSASTGPWSLQVASSPDKGSIEGGAIQSEIDLVLRETSGPGGGNAVAQGSRRTGIVLGGQPATAPGGRSFSLDDAVRPSWSDPPGVDLAAGLGLSVISEGQSLVLLAVVDPNPLVEGYAGRVRFWYWVAGPHPAGTPVELAVDRGGERIGRAVGSLAHGDWNVVDWTPESPLAPGYYTFEILSESNATLAKGSFHVYDLATHDSVLAPLAFTGVPSSAAASSGAPGGGPHLLPKMGLAVRLVSGDQVRSTWEATVVNASPIYALEVQVEICPPPGWAWLSANAPWKSAAAGQASGGLTAGSPGGSADRETGLGSVAICHAVLLGSIKGQSERSFRFSLQPPGSFGPAAPLFARPVPPGHVPRPWVSFYVKTAPALGEPGVVVYEAQVPVDPKDFFEATTIRGRTFVDVNGSGSWEEGEPLVGGADIVVDGVVAARSTAAGAFTVEVHQRPLVMWARTSRGMGVPVSLTGHADLRSLWIVDLALPPSAVSPPAPGGEGNGRTEAFLHAGTSFGAGGALSGAGAHFHRRSERWELRASAAAGQRTALTQGGPGAETSASFSVDGSFHGGAGTVSAAWRRGLLEEIAWGGLRPSKPVFEAWRIAFEAEPAVVSAPFGLQPIASGAAEAGGAIGDLWRCSVREVATGWSFGDLWFMGGRRWGEHVRLEKKGEVSESYGEASIGLRGLLNLAGSDWPYRLDLAWGRERTLAPSCGLSPKDGIHGRAQLSWPQAAPGEPEGLLGSVTGALSLWTPSGNEPAGALWRASERAVEIAVESADLAKRFGSEGALKVSPFVQFGVVPKEADRFWSALGVRAEARYSGHKFTLEAGPKPVYERKPSADVPPARAGRLAGAWRYQGGPLGARIAFDRDGLGTKYDYEAGISLTAVIAPERAPWIGREARLAFSLARALSESGRDDEVSLSIARGGRSEPADRLAVEWEGSVDAPGLGYFSGPSPYDAAKASVAFSRTRPGALVTRADYEARPAFRPEGWTVRLDYARERASVEYSQTVAAEGVWRLGTWLVELRRAQGWEGGAPFENTRSRVAWDLHFKGWGLYVELERSWNRHEGFGGAGGRAGFVVRGTRRVSHAVELFAQVGQGMSLASDGSAKLAEAGGVQPGPAGSAGGAWVAFGVTVDFSKLRAGGFLAGLPLVFTAGVESGVSPAASPASHGEPTFRYFAGVGLPLGLPSG